MQSGKGLQRKRKRGAGRSEVWIEVTAYLAFGSGEVGVICQEGQGALPYFESCD